MLSRARKKRRFLLGERALEDFSAIPCRSPLKNFFEELRSFDPLFGRWPSKAVFASRTIWARPLFPAALWSPVQEQGKRCSLELIQHRNPAAVRRIVSLNNPRLV